MGYLRNKYTKEYFTGRNRFGKKVGYGVEGYEDFLKGDIRKIDLSILSQINFKNKNVLEFGFGRGEAIKYGKEHGANIYTGVDFSKQAINIAKKFLKSFNINGFKLYCDDALSYLKKSINNNPTEKYDIILMFDFIEHIPRTELTKIMVLLNKKIKKKSIIAINTPNFKFDNDVIKEGLDNRNNLDTFDTFDLIEATKGMHCNKYSTISLQKFMKKCGYLNITEHHFYIPKKTKTFFKYDSYKANWNKYFNEKYPINKNYEEDQIETPNKLEFYPEWITINHGHLKGINLYLTQGYYKTVLSYGEYDQQLFYDLQKNTNHKEIVFDIGGFMGINSLLFSKIIGQKSEIITFEPNPYNVNRMLINFSKNEKTSKNISVINIAISNKIGSTKLLLSNNIDNGYSSTSRLLNTHVEHSQEHLKDLGFFNEKVHQSTIDQFVTSTKIIPNIIKVDIEGAEHLLLLGAKGILKKYSPILYIELHSQYCALKCTEIMDCFGYKNNIIFEESDNRILVKFYKDKSKNNKKKSIKEIETKIHNDQFAIYKKENIDQQKLESDIENEKEKILKELIDKEKYLNKIINNPIIKPQLMFFKIIKKIFNLF